MTQSMEQVVQQVIQRWVPTLPLRGRFFHAAAFCCGI